MPCALAVALVGGCKDAKRSPPAADDAGVATAVAPPSDVEGAFEEPTDYGTAIFLAAGDGGVSPVVREDAPNMRYARLGRDSCLAELGRRGIAFEEAPATAWAEKPRVPVARIDKPAKAVKQAAGAKKKKRASSAAPAALAKHGKQVKPARPAKQPKAAPPPPVEASQAHVAVDEASSQVLAPVRLRGPIRGIAIHSGLPEKRRATSTIEIFDCRLVLALDDFATLLAKHDVVEIVHMSAFRSQRDGGCTPKYPGKQHCGALAVDVGVLKKRDGSVLDVDKDWNGRIGMPTCADGTGPNPVTPAANELWDIVCDTARRALFHVMLTPNFNVEHKNHFHLEVTPDVGWMLIK